MTLQNVIYFGLMMVILGAFIWSYQGWRVAVSELKHERKESEKLADKVLDLKTRLKSGQVTQHKAFEALNDTRAELKELRSSLRAANKTLGGQGELITSLTEERTNLENQVAALYQVAIPYATWWGQSMALARLDSVTAFERARKTFGHDMTLQSAALLAYAQDTTPTPKSKPLGQGLSDRLARSTR